MKKVRLSELSIFFAYLIYKLYLFFYEIFLFSYWLRKQLMESWIHIHFNKLLTVFENCSLFCQNSSLFDFKLLFQVIQDLKWYSSSDNSDFFVVNVIIFTLVKNIIYFIFFGSTKIKNVIWNLIYLSCVTIWPVASKYVGYAAICTSFPIFKINFLCTGHKNYFLLIPWDIFEVNCVLNVLF